VQAVHTEKQHFSSLLVLLMIMLIDARACSTYDHFLIRSSLLTNKLMSHVFIQSRLQAAFCNFYGHYKDLVCHCNLPLGQIPSDVFHTNRLAVLDTLILTTFRTVHMK
jgi:hypothetical protein